MTEHNPHTQLEQPGRLGSFRGRGRDAQHARGTPQQQRVTDRFRSGDQHQEARLIRKLLATTLEALLDASRHAKRLLDAKTAGQLGCTQLPW